MKSVSYSEMLIPTYQDTLRNNQEIYMNHRLQRSLKSCIKEESGGAKVWAIRDHDSRYSFCIYQANGNGILSWWPRRLRSGSAAARLLGLWVRTSPQAWLPVSCECRILLGRGPCVELITRPEESYRVWCVSM
jgi:hypothetical protein